MASLTKRTRTKGDLKTGTFWVRDTRNQNTSAYHPTGTWRLPRTLTYGTGSVIIDETTPYANGKPTMSLEQSKRIFKNVSNTTMESSIDDVDTIDTSEGFFANYEWHRGWMISYLDSTNPFLNIPTLELFKLVDVQKAFKALQPSLKDAKVDGINIYTAVLELADLRKTFSRASVSLGKTMASTVAEKNLLINFGLLPLFGDIKAIYDIVTKLSDYIDTWNAAAYGGIVFDSHKELPKIDDSKSFSFLAAPPIFNDWSYNVSSKDFSISAKAKVHMYYKPKPIPDGKRIDVYKRALGLDQPLKGIWEAVPFSWAIDYFLNVGELIDHFDEKIGTMFQFEYISGGYSIKSTAGGMIQYDAVGRPVPNGALRSFTTPPSFSRPYYRHTFIRERLSLGSMLDYMSATPELHLQLSAGPKQFSYLASVAYLRSLK